MDIETRFKNFKAAKMVIEADSIDGMTTCDDDQGLKATGEKGKFKLEIKNVQRNGENFTLPIATFVSI